jgi:hypothetical protein
MIPELYRSFETRTLKDLVSYGDPAQEELRLEDWDGVDEGDPAGGRALAPWRRSRVSLRRRTGKWFRLGRRLITRSGLR